jgi:hypothetical protein
VPDVPLAVIRPDEWDLPLFLHVLGAMLLVGTLLLAGLVLFARRDAGLGFRVLLLGVLPSYILMRVGGEWIASEENFGDSEPDWLTVGYITADLGAVLIVVSLVLTGIAARRSRRPEARGGALIRVSGGIAYLLLAAYIVAVWAMTAKPGA